MSLFEFLAALHAKRPSYRYTPDPNHPSRKHDRPGLTSMNLFLPIDPFPHGLRPPRRQRRSAMIARAKSQRRVRVQKQNAD